LTQDEYEQRVMLVLSQHTDAAASQLSRALGLLPDGSKEVAIEIFVDQDGEGFLDVQVGVRGPDLYVLNRVIAPNAKLFTTVMTETALQPDLPLMSARHRGFPVRDVLTDCGAIWATHVWEKANHATCRLPVFVMAPEGSGTRLPIRLQ
jgi:hypothetical protein